MGIDRPTPATTTVVAFNNIIDGARVEAADGRRLDVLSPSDGVVFASIPRSSAVDVDRAVKAARAAFDTGPWGQMAAVDRGRVLMRLSQLITTHAEELATFESRDTGKPIRQGRADMVATARYFEFYAGAADKLTGDTIPTIDGFLAMTIREPHGVVGGVIPWNYPAQIMGRVAGAALAAGNTVVLKPAEDACLSVVRIAELALEAGVPPGAFNVVTGLGAEAGAALSAHPGLDFLTFTGSPEVGTLIQQAAAVNHIGVTLELGGKSPQIVFADADLHQAIPVIVNAIIQNAGQTCSAGSRVLIERTAFDEVARRLAERFTALVAGPWDADLDLGALVNAKQKARVERFLARAEAEQVPILARGRIAANAPEAGQYVAPALVGPVPRDNALAQEEVFGPVLSLIPFEDEADAIALANGTPYGLVAGVWTRDGQRAVRIGRKVRAGQVFLNAYGAGGGVELPFGGFKKSGHGREKGFEALHHFTAPKTLVIKHG